MKDQNDESFREIEKIKGKICREKKEEKNIRK